MDEHKLSYFSLEAILYTILTMENLGQISQVYNLWNT